MLVEGADSAVGESSSAPEGDSVKPQSVNPGPVPYSRFQEVVKQKNELQAENAQLKGKIASAESAQVDAEAKARLFSEQLDSKINAEVEKNSALQTIVEQYKETFTAIVGETTKDWPAELLAFDPGADADPVMRVEWMKNGSAMVEKLRGNTAQPFSPGAAPKPAPATNQPQSKEVKLPIDVKRSF